MSTTMSEALVTCPVCQIPNFTPQGLKAHRCKGPLAGALARAAADNANTAGQAVADPLPDPLPGIKAAIMIRHDEMQGIQRRAEDDALPHALCIGLQCYRAHVIFALPANGRKGVGGRGKKTPPTAGGVSKGGFEGWLEREEIPLSSGSAYRAMTAFRGLGLDETADEALVEVTLADLRRIALAAGAPAPSLKSLIAAATDRLSPPAEPPAPPHQLTFDDYVATLKQLREDAEHAIEQAKDMPEPLRKQLVARFYASLHALTGTHWQPSDEAHELGTIDPDTITL